MINDGKLIPYVSVVENKKDIDEKIILNPDGGDVFQSLEMSEFKSEHDWKWECWQYHLTDKIVTANVLVRAIIGFGNLAYIMRGPGITTKRDLTDIIAANKKAFCNRFFLIKMEPPLLESEMNGQVFKDVVANRAIQPNAHTIVVDLGKSEEEILASFRQRARREIRAGIKEGLMVKRQPLNQTTMDKMYELYETTSVRAGFVVRGKAYHQQLWRKFNQAGHGDLFFVYSNEGEDPIAGAFVCYLGKKAVYKDGGSTRTSNKHFAHLLQWEIMKYLKGVGVKSYDLHGVPPSGQINDPNHPLFGLAIFKLSFSNEVIDYVGVLDQIIQPLRYQRWRKWGERMYRSYLRRVRHAFLY